METELGMDTMLYFRRLTDAVFDHEETMELVVPDTLPDVSYVSDAVGTVVLRTKEARADALFASGTVQGCVLYMPEGESSPRGIEVSVPWSFTADCAGLDTAGRLSVRAELTGLEARIINSRKIVVRASLALTVRAYAAAEASWCSDARGDAEILLKEHKVTAVSDVSEKTFSVTETAAIPASGPPIGRILGCRAEMTGSTVRSAGRRLILSGNAELEILYAAQMSGELAGARMTLPYTQTLELIGDESGTDCEAVVMLTGVYVKENQASEETVHTVSVELGAVAQLAVRRESAVNCVADLYGTSCATETDTDVCRIDAETSCESRTLSLREQLSCDERVRSVLSCAVTAGRPSADGASLRIPVRMKVICAAGDGRPVSVEGRAELTADCPAARGDGVSVDVADVSAAVTAGGVEVTASVSAIVRRFCTAEIRYVSAVREVPEENSAPRPSIVVVRTGADDDLWSIAKRYRTSRESIRRANGLEADAEAVSGDMLIITSAI